VTQWEGKILPDYTASLRIPEDITLFLLEGLGRRKCLFLVSRYPDRGLNPGPSQYEARFLATVVAVASLVQGDIEEQSGTVFPCDSALLVLQGHGQTLSHVCQICSVWVQVASPTFRRYMLGDDSCAASVTVRTETSGGGALVREPFGIVSSLFLCCSLWP
jgi:hypothetical protein